MEKNQAPADGKPAVFIQHGYFDSADITVMNGPENSLAFYLANQGFDVWIGNARGNKFSRKHSTLNPDLNTTYWDFSFVERVEDDKANIEYVRSATKQNKIGFIAHSEAAATMLTGLSQNSEWFKQRITVLITLGAVAKVDKMQSLLLRSLGITNIPISSIKLFGIHEFFYPNFMTKIWFSTICGYIPQLCQFTSSTMSEGNTSVNDPASTRVYFGHYPAGISVKSLEHTLQCYQSGKFQYFDYGVEENRKKYQSDTPPEINLKTISGMKIGLFVGSYDLYGDEEDSKWLRDILGSNVVTYNTYDYGHITYFVGKDMAYLYDVKFLLNTYKSEGTLEINNVDERLHEISN